MHLHRGKTTSRSDQSFKTITKWTRRVAHDGRLTPSYLPMLGVMKLSYASSPLDPFYTPRFESFPRDETESTMYHKEPTVSTDHIPLLINVLLRRRPKCSPNPQPVTPMLWVLRLPSSTSFYKQTHETRMRSAQHPAPSTIGRL